MGVYGKRATIYLRPSFLIVCFDFPTAPLLAVGFFSSIGPPPRLFSPNPPSFCFGPFALPKRFQSNRYGNVPEQFIPIFCIMQAEKPTFFMKRKGILVAVSLLILAMSGYCQVKSKAYRLMLKSLLDHSVPETSVQSTARDTTPPIFLDAREPKEFAVSHLKNAIPVGYDHFDLKKLPVLDKNSRIVVYCSVGYRSEKIAEKLLAAGYKNVSNLYGGIFEWVNQDNPVYNEAGQTAKVHAYDRTWGVWLNKGEKIY